MRLIAPLVASLAVSGCAAAPGWIAAEGVEPILQEQELDCGAAALAALLGRWGVPATPAELRERCRSGPEGIAASALREVARERGLEAYLLRAGREDLEYELSRGRPVLAGVVRSGRAHYVLVTAIRPGGVLLADPAVGWREQSWRGFEREWAGAAHLAMAAFPPE